MSSSSSSTPHFLIPKIQDNLSGGWGPISGSAPLKLSDDLDAKGIPYAPFTKSARLCKVSDWNSSFAGRTAGTNQRTFNRPNNRDDTPRNEAFFDRQHLNEDTSNFQMVVDEKKAAKKNRRVVSQSSRFRFGNRRGNLNRVIAAAQAEPDQPRGKASKHLFKPMKGKRQELARQRWTSYTHLSGASTTDREPSVVIKDSWALCAEFPFESLRLSADEVQKVPDELASAGALQFYESSDRGLQRKEQTLAKHYTTPESLPFLQSSSKDPILRELAEQGEGNFFITDELLAVLMTAERSVYPWDLVFTRRGGHVFVDKRDESLLGFYTVNETANEQPRDDRHNPVPMESTTHINAPAPLALESTRVNANFHHQALSRGGASHAFERPSPFEGESAARLSRAYRYRRWALGDSVRVVVRCSLDGVRTVRDQTEFLTIRALNEFDPRADGMNWRAKLGSQPGAIIATEMKSNSAKMSRWLLQSILSGSHSVLIGYVSRGTYKSNTTHVILGNQFYRPHELVGQLALDTLHCWGTVKAIAVAVLEQPEGKYCLLRESNTPSLSLFRVPLDENFEYIEERYEDTEAAVPFSSSSLTPVPSSSSSIESEVIAALPI